MATPAAPVEHTTELALSEKRKLVKSLGHLDMVFFTVCAIVGLDLLGQAASYGAQAFTWVLVLVVLFMFPYALLMAELGTALFPALIKLRYSHADVPRVFSVPGGKVGFWAIGVLCTLWVLMGSWVAIFPDTLEYVFGADYGFTGYWGVSRLRFEVFTLGTLAVVIAFAVVGYLAGRSVREQVVDVPLAATPAPAAGD
jgi:amino acid transporter